MQKSANYQQLAKKGLRLLDVLLIKIIILWEPVQEKYIIPILIAIIANFKKLLSNYMIIQGHLRKAHIQLSRKYLRNLSLIEIIRPLHLSEKVYYLLLPTLSWVRSHGKVKMFPMTIWIYRYRQMMLMDASLKIMRAQQLQTLIIKSGFLMLDQNAENQFKTNN